MFSDWFAFLSIVISISRLFWIFYLLPLTSICRFDLRWALFSISAYQVSPSMFYLLHSNFNSLHWFPYFFSLSQSCSWFPHFSLTWIPNSSNYLLSHDTNSRSLGAFSVASYTVLIFLQSMHFSPIISSEFRYNSYGNNNRWFRIIFTSVDFEFWGRKAANWAYHRRTNNHKELSDEFDWISK